MIEGVIVKKLRVMPDERGFLIELLRSDEEAFKEFGQVYLTTCYPGVVKGWHYHKKQMDNFICVKGMAKVVLYDNRENSPTYGEVNEFFIGEQNYSRITIPPMVIHGFKGVSKEMAYIINCPNKLYNYDNPDEYRLPFDSDEIPYNWDIKMGQ